MLCYADAYVDHTIKISYIILTETGSIAVRYDCYFCHFTPFPSLVNEEVENRHPSTFVEENPVDYDDMLINLQRALTPQTETIYNQLVTTLTMISYSVMPSTVILRNPSFLKEVTARLQRNEDEAYSDDESFVSITEVPFADPSTAEIHNAHKPHSDPLEPRVTGSKSKALNIVRLRVRRGTEFRCSSRASYRSQ
jgi:hypothetical protein